MTESTSARWIRGLVKFVFILCYVSFMWASIHHVATYFDNFEQNSSGNQFGSYLLAGAFDLTALVTTIGVMFFRKSMPGYIQVIVWIFILAIAGYSFFINWEYSAHYQNIDLTLQPTGQTTPVYDVQGNLHYVPVMQQNTALIFVNPFLASGFTIFSLIYSVVAEFFGTKPPTAQELLEKKKYLEETQSIQESIRQLEEKNKGKSLIQKAKEAAKESKDAWNELRKKEETTAESEKQIEEVEEETSEQIEAIVPETPMIRRRNTDELKREKIEESIRQIEEAGEENPGNPVSHFEGKPEESDGEFDEENVSSWLSGSGSTIRLSEVSLHTKISLRTLRNRVKKHEMTATKNPDIVYKQSLVNWLQKAGYLQDTGKIIQIKSAQNSDEAEKQIEDIAQENEKQISEVAQESLTTNAG